MTEISVMVTEKLVMTNWLYKLFSKSDMTKKIGNDQKSVMTKIEIGYVSYAKKSVITKKIKILDD